MGETKETKSFWSTLPGILTALAAFATAIGGCITIIVSSPTLMNMILPPTPSVTVIAMGTTDTPIPVTVAITDTPRPPTAITETAILPTVQVNLCDQLAGKSVNINQANGFRGVIGPSGIPLIVKSQGSYEFTSVAAFHNEQIDVVSGNCNGNTFTFSRTRPNAFIQDFKGTISQKSDGVLSLDGSVIDRVSGQSVTWSGQVTEAFTPNGLCDQLTGKSISINQANGFQGVVGSSGIQLITKSDGSYTFTGFAVYRNEPADPVTGSCRENTLTFTRTRANTFIQDFTATISPGTGGILKLNGFITDRATGLGTTWTGQVVLP